MRKRYSPREKGYFRQEIPVTLPFDFIYKHGASTCKKLYVLLHGYEENAQRIFDKISPVIPADAHVFAANGPFPIPRKVEGNYRIGFSWYFYDFAQKEYYIDMQVALKLLYKSVLDLNLQEHEITVIGFSQGGYLAPFLGLQFLNTKKVIGIGCEYLVGEFLQPMPFAISAIHGKKDSVVSIEAAQSSFVQIKNNSGNFYALENTEHRLDSDVLSALKKLL